MMNKIFNKTNLIAFAILAVLLMPVMTMAAGSNLNFGLDDAESIGLGNEPVKDVVVSVVKVILGFLGLVAVIIILAGGFMWMTAGGNEDKVGKGRKLIINGVIGLIIVLAAFSIATFVIDTVGSAINGDAS